MTTSKKDQDSDEIPPTEETSADLPTTPPPFGGQGAAHAADPVAIAGETPDPAGTEAERWNASPAGALADIGSELASELVSPATKDSSKDAELEEDLEPLPPSRFKKTLHILGWIAAGLFFLLFFTWVKLPDDKIKNYIAGSINAQLASEGVSLSAAETDLSFLFGPSYSLKNVTVTLPPPASPIRLDKLEVSPSVLALLIGKVGGEVKIQNGEGRLRGAFSFRGSKGSVRLKVEKMEVDKLGILPYLAGIQAAGILDGEAAVEGDLNVPNTLEGSASFHVKKLLMEPQTIYGFALPKISVSEAEIESLIEKGKAPIKTLRLGKPGSADDLQATVTGDLTLGKSWQASNLNIKAKFSVSENITKSLILIDALLGPGKQADGSYHYALTGPLDGVIAAPVGTQN